MHPSDVRFGVVDFETTGFDAEKDRPVSFGAVLQTLAPGPVEHFYRLMNPGIHIPAQASAVHHLTDRMVEHALNPEWVMADWWDNEKTSRCDVLVAHNAEFDSRFMEAVAPGRASVPWLCTMRLAKKLWPDDEHSNNQYLRYQHNVEVVLPEGLTAHNALYDAIVTAGVLRMALNEYLSRCAEPGLVDILGIIDWTKEPMLLNTCRFGNKHYGEPWKEVPRSYLRWMWSNVTDMDMDTRHTVAHYLGIAQVVSACLKERTFEPAPVHLQTFGLIHHKPGGILRLPGPVVGKITLTGRSADSGGHLERRDMDFPVPEQHPFLVVDLETTGLQWWKDKIVMMAMSTPDGKDYALDFRDPIVQRWAKFELPKARKLVNQNLKFDLHFLRREGVNYHGPVGDTMVFAALLDEHRLTYDLDSLGMDYLGIGKDNTIYQVLADMFGGKPTKHAQGKNLHKAPWDILSKYAKQDTRTALGLYELELTELEAQQLGPVAELEMDLLPVLLDMEHGGVRVDLDAAERAVLEISEQAVSKQEKLNRLAGFEVNPNPSGSIKKLFDPKQDKLGNWILVDGTVAGKTDAGAASIDADCLRRMQHPAAKLILSLRQLLKTRDTFLKGHILGHHHNGVIHANFNQTKSDNDLGTGTGRLSCNDPALQQIHKRNKEVAAVVRAVFLPDEGQQWNCRDWEQADFRVFAHYAANPRILAMYQQTPDTDFHQMVADMTGLPRSMTPGIKGNAKQINLGLVFGMGEGKLAQEMGLPYTTETRNGREFLIPGDEALEVFKQYHQSVPGIKSLLAKASSVAKSRGFVKTIMGRRIRFPGKKFTHKAGGLIFQGTAADALKIKLVEVHQALKGTGARLLLNVHDELDMSFPFEGADKIDKMVGELYNCFDGIKCPIRLDVPMRSSSGMGCNWWEASR